MSSTVVIPQVGGGFDAIILGMFLCQVQEK